MSYYEQANRINKDLKDFMNSPLQQLNDNQKEFILNLIIQVGQVAKFRCRSNSAYDNFINECFKDIANCKRVKRNDNDEWETLRAEMKDKSLFKAIDENDQETIKELTEKAEKGQIIRLV